MSEQTASRQPVLCLSRGQETLFSSTRPWLHPILDLTEFLSHESVDLSGCTLYDKIIGRAAALLIVRLGIRSVQTDVISRRAIPVFEGYGVVWQGGETVERIDCRTEEILADEYNPDTAFRIIRARAIAARTASDPDSCALRVEGVRVVRGEKLVLDDFNLRVGLGEKLLITGANGAGKTSLLKTILGTVTPDAGRIVFSTAHTRAGRIGYVNQESVPVSFPVSAREVVAIGVAAVHASREERQTRIREAMQATGSEALSRRMYATLSGGEKQRIAIARCLAQQAQLLLLDEPTASLDADGKRDIVALLEYLADEQGITVILVTHEFDSMDRSGWRHVALETSA